MLRFHELVVELSRAWKTGNRKLLVLAARYYRGIDSLQELREHAPPAMVDWIVAHH